MSEHRQHSPRSPLQQPHKPTSKFNKTFQNTPPVQTYGMDSKQSQKQTAVSSQRSAGDYEPKYHDFTTYRSGCSSSIQVEHQLEDVKQKLAKEQQRNYIYQQFFKKIQKILYSEHSDQLQGTQIKDYQKLQMHLADMAKRIQKGSHYCKLSAVPVMYKKNNTVTTSTVVNRQVKK